MACLLYQQSKPRPLVQAFTPHVMYSPNSRGPSLEYSGFEAALLHNHQSEDEPRQQAAELGTLCASWHSDARLRHE